MLKLTNAPGGCMRCAVLWLALDDTMAKLVLASGAKQGRKFP